MRIIFTRISAHWGVATVGDKAAGTLFELLKKRLTHPGAKEALTDLAAQPDDQDAQATLRTQLRKAFETDPELAKEVQSWAQQSGTSPAPTQVATQTGGSGNKINQVQGSGNNVS